MTGAFQVLEQLVESRERFHGHQWSTHAQLRAFRSQHPFWKKTDPPVGSLAVSALAILVLGSPPYRQGETKEGVPTVVHRDAFQTVCIM
jgi:hypothetical protein